MRWQSFQPLKPILFGIGVWRPPDHKLDLVTLDTYVLGDISTLQRDCLKFGIGCGRSKVTRGGARVAIMTDLVCITRVSR